MIGEAIFMRGSKPTGSRTPRPNRESRDPRSCLPFCIAPARGSWLPAARRWCVTLACRAPRALQYSCRGAGLLPRCLYGCGACATFGACPFAFAGGRIR